VVYPEENLPKQAMCYCRNIEHRIHRGRWWKQNCFDLQPSNFFYIL